MPAGKYPLACAALTIWLLGAGPATQPGQSDLDFLLSQSKAAATQPADGDVGPTTHPVSPFNSDLTDGAREGTILLSDGKKIHGLIAHTQRKPVRIWIAEASEYKDVPFASIRSIQAKVVWERDEKEWHFKESGSDVKEYSGKTYPARATEYVVTLDDGTTVSGGVVEPLYLLSGDGPVTFALHKRDKGETGQTLDQLVYVKQVDFAGGSPATQPAK
jgi:hypothetical protein